MKTRPLNDVTAKVNSDPRDVSYPLPIARIKTSLCFFTIQSASVGTGLKEQLLLQS